MADAGASPHTFGDAAPPPAPAREHPGPVAEEPPRSGLAYQPATAAWAERERRAQPNGWWGMLLFVAAEATIFGGLIATYFYLDFGSPRWPPAGVSAPSVVAPIILTAVLVATSVPMALAARGARAGRRSVAAAMLALALVVQCGYVAYQLHLFVGELPAMPPQQSAYASIYFTLLGVHHGHVVLGILLNIGVLLGLARRGLTNYQLIGVRSLALYWYVVNTLAIAVLFTQISPTL